MKSNYKSSEMRLIKKGKVKDIYETDANTLIFSFSDRVSAFDVTLNDPIPFKGKILCDFAVFWFEKLNTQNHFIKRIDSRKIEVKKLTIIPIEFVVRGFLYGSFYSRYINNEISPNQFGEYFKTRGLKLASKLPGPVFDPSTKSDLHDEPTSEEEIVANQILSPEDLTTLKDLSIHLFNNVGSIVFEADFLLSDIKFEFGRDPKSNEICLADSIGPDEFRIWDKRDYHEGTLQRSYDKQILRDWLEKIGFKKELEICSKMHSEPRIPQLPQVLTSKITNSYINAYERITGLSFSKTY